MAVWHDPCKTDPESFIVKIQRKIVGLYTSMYGRCQVCNNEFVSVTVILYVTTLGIGQLFTCT